MCYTGLAGRGFPSELLGRAHDRRAGYNAGWGDESLPSPFYTWSTVQDALWVDVVHQAELRPRGLATTELLHDATVGGPACELVAAGELQFAQHRRNVSFDRLDRDRQLACDLLVRQTPGNKPENFLLPRG